MRVNTGFYLFILLILSSAAMAQDVFDTDLDGYDDNADNCTLAWNPDQRDTDGDYNGNMCDADFNNDGLINAIDLNMMRVEFLGSNEHTDLNGDGATNFGDINIMAAMYFSSPGPTATNPDQPPCDCYFSNDCNDGDPTTQLFCWYGPGSFSTEDNCVWRDIKPRGNYLSGCSIESDLTTGAWEPDICDGVCTESNRGSAIGLEDRGLVAQTILLWGEAMISPSAAGGGPVDPELAARASAIEFNGGPGVPYVIGRQTADALAMAAGDPFHDYFCHFEGHPEDEDQPVVDLAGEDCRIAAGQLTLQALASEILTPGTAAGIMKGIARVCPQWQQMFTTQCKAGPNALNCAIEFIEAQAYFLSTPPVTPSAAPDPLGELLGVASR